MHGLMNGHPKDEAAVVLGPSTTGHTVDANSRPTLQHGLNAGVSMITVAQAAVKRLPTRGSAAEPM